MSQSHAPFISDASQHSVPAALRAVVLETKRLANTALFECQRGLGEAAEHYQTQHFGS